MALPAIGGALARGLLAGGTRAAAAGAAKEVATNAAKSGMKNFAKNMVGKTSDAYKANVQGINPETGEYLTPEERKARFKGFVGGGSGGIGGGGGTDRRLSAGPSQAVAALPPSKGFNASEDSQGDSQNKVVDHLAKVKEYLEKLLVLENKAYDRLQNRILDTAREEERDAASAEEAKQETGTKKRTKKNENPLVKGAKKKAQGIFGFLMDLGMKFIGFKILDWISNPENQEKVQGIVEFFQGVISFATTIANAIGTGWNWTVDTVIAGIEGVKTVVNSIKEFFTFEWLDLDEIFAQFDGFISFFTKTVPELVKKIVDYVSQIPKAFKGIVDKLVGSFLGWLGLAKEDTAEIEEPKNNVPVSDSDLQGSTPLPPGPEPSQKDKPKATTPEAGEENPKMSKGGALKGPSHSKGGVDINAEGGEYVLNKKVVSAIGTAALDRLNFGMFPNKHNGPGYGAGGHVVTSSMGNRSFALSPGMHMGVDIGTGVGEKLQAFNDGVVEGAGYDGGYGNYVSWIDNKTGLGNFYGHMNQPARVKPGQKVSKGTVLGYTGNTGRSSGPHLHWEVAKNPADTGRSKSNVLSRINPLSKYSKEAPFGGTTTADSSSIAETEKTDLDSSYSGEENKQDTTTTESGFQLPSISDALVTFSKLMGGMSGEELDKSQTENNKLTSADESPLSSVFTKETAPNFTTAFDENTFGNYSLGDNVPDLSHIFYPVNL